MTICRYCNKPLPLNTKAKIFCSKRCTSRYHWSPSGSHQSRRTVDRGQCRTCNALILFKKDAYGHVRTRKLCDTCIVIDFSKMTKGKLFNQRSTWQSARSTIRKHAYKVFSSSGRPSKCQICDYDKHIQVAHIQSVSIFANDTPISVINDICNLIALCPNHHWEYDHGLLAL